MPEGGTLAGAVYKEQLPGLRGGSQSLGRHLAPFQGSIALMAEFLTGGDTTPALGAKGVSLFRMQQETAAGAAISLAYFIGIWQWGH